MPVAKETVYTLEDVVDAINNISLETSGTTSLSVDDYNLVSSIWEELHEISKTLKRIADNQ